MFEEELVRRRIRKLPYPVGVSVRELEMFDRLNTNEAEVRDEAERIRAEKRELDGFSSKEVVVIKRKIDHLHNIEKVISTGTTLVNILAFMTVPKESMIFEATGIVKKNTLPLAIKAIDYFEPDYSPEDRSEKPEDKKVIISDVETVKISKLLMDFKVPEGIAGDAESLYEKGPNSQSIISLCTHIATRLIAKDNPEVNADNFDFSTP